MDLDIGGGARDVEGVVVKRFAAVGVEPDLLEAVEKVADAIEQPALLLRSFGPFLGQAAAAEME